jgi:hypothetical protein
MGKAAIIGISIGGVVLILGLVAVATYALRQKRIAKEAVERTTNPFGNVYQRLNTRKITVLILIHSC